MGLSEQVTQMRAEQGRLSSAISALGERITGRLDSLQAKLEAAGEVDPDLTADIDSLREAVSQLEGIVPAPSPVEDVPVDPAPVDEGGSTEESEVSENVGGV